ncbi:hypothetical protein LGL08_19835 [Clostridium estertheticum]|uniref:hypothetical protein n=1 Tax=Clostridium estertheticum TaxID=238834 RepID=UPI001CF3E049|nr:hypothetical protein [Clostridium estertheticum]MCB2308793.1 hypothetical protein [Clostridium estertheticum]MCB2347129.1 hypothetical protein [Clostridium estertheticum]MCB2351779.1 hypothetical protein [Clostridium estertheticum]WAG44499.1 hypothetical protein LL127_13105 [Clostridium estertheticum]
MGEKEELKMELNRVIYRHNMLGIMEVKLLQMREIAKQVKEEKLSAVEIEALNARLNNLAVQVNALDEESRNTENEGIVE